ncbi:hypothetical protein C0995_001273 [Termitomyces sp. Mi166|nr:hypothetical protein C0995_001273 [Termitomyces sp. Mi166\
MAGPSSESPELTERVEDVERDVAREYPPGLEKKTIQLPSNMIVQKLGPRVWLTICVIGWGATQLGMGFVPEWGYLVLCRVFLGYALTLIAPRGGLNGWQWIFVIEGAITIVVGFITYFIFPNFPDKNRFLSAEQTKLVLDRVEKDRGDSLPDKMTWTKLRLHLSDWKIWVFALMLMCVTVPTYVSGYFAPIILASMGYNVRNSLLLSAPPGVIAALLSFVSAYISDRLRRRALLITIQTILTITGLSLIGYAESHGVRYFGACASVPGVLSYSANNVVTHTKRSVSTAVIVAFAGVGGIFATTV